MHDEIPPYMVIVGGEIASSHPTMEEAVAEASQLDEDGVQDPIQIVDAKAKVVREGASLTQAILEYRERRRS